MNDRTNNQRILDNHGNITQSGNIIYNYYSISNPNIKIELKEPYKIYIFNLIKNEQIKYILLISCLPIFSFSMILLYTVTDPNLYKFLKIFLGSYIILGILLFLLNYFQIVMASLKASFKKIDYKNYILIDKEKIEILKEKETSIIINFKEIRKIEIEKNYMIGYNVLIYNKQLKPTLSYNVHYREKALLIKELFEEHLKI